MQTPSKPLLVVTPPAATLPLPAAKYMINVPHVTRVFPAIHEHQPFAIVLDHDFLAHETEKILRRLTVNPFYSKIKIYCYKSRPHTKVDGLLAALGVQHFIYANTAEKPKANIAGRVLGYVFDSVGSNLVDVAN